MRMLISCFCMSLCKERTVSPLSEGTELAPLEGISSASALRCCARDSKDQRPWSPQLGVARGQSWTSLGLRILIHQMEALFAGWALESTDAAISSWRPSLPLGLGAHSSALLWVPSAFPAALSP